MKYSGKSILGAVIVTLVAVNSLAAADLFGSHKADPWSKSQSRLTSFDDYGVDYARWYVRLDGAAGFGSDIDIIEDDIYPLVNDDFETSWSVGGGIGAYLGKNFRGDLTIDWRFESDISGLQTAWPEVVESREFQVETLLALANLYYDFHGIRGGGAKDGPTMTNRITPYIGAGIGFAHHRTDGGLGETLPGQFSQMGDVTETNFAFALMAGVNCKINDAMHLDVGYRYLDMGDLESGHWDNTMGLGQLEVEDLNVHEIRIGLRHSFR